jgi:hypothetical protein
VADVIRDGGLPYKDAWDIKGPGTFYTVALGQLVLGRHTWALRVVDLVLLAVTCAALARITRAWGGARLGAVVAPGLFALWYLGAGFWDTAQPDAWATTALATGVAIVVTGQFDLHRRMALAGLLIGAGTAYKPIFAVFVVVLVAAWAATTEDGRPPWSALAAGIGGAAVVPVVVLLWFWLRGGLGDLLEVQLEFNRTSYRASTPVPDQLGAIRNYLVSQVGVALPVAALGTVALLARRRGSGVVALCWLLTGLAVVVSQGRFFTYHWVPLSAVLAVTAAVGCAQLVEARVPAAVLAGTLLVASAWGPVDAAVRRVIDARADDRTYRDAFVKADFSAAKDKRISAWLREHTEPDDAVLLWGYEPAVFFLSHRSSATRFGYTLPVVGEGGRTRLVNRYRAELVADVRRDPPPYVVIVEGDTNPVVPDGSRRAFEEFPELESFVSSRYEEVATIGHDATVLRLQPS